MRKLLLILLCLPFIGFGQSETIEIIARDFNNKHPITVSNYDSEDLSLMNDGTSATTLLEKALFKNGFDVLSNAVAVERANISNTYNSGSQNIVYDTKSTIYYSSVYLIKLDIAWDNKRQSEDYRGKGRYGKVEGWDYRARVLNGSVIDLVNEGKIVATFEFVKEKKEADQIYTKFTTTEILNEIAKELFIEGEK